MSKIAGRSYAENPACHVGGRDSDREAGTGSDLLTFFRRTPPALCVSLMHWDFLFPLQTRVRFSMVAPNFADAADFEFQQQQQMTVVMKVRGSCGGSIAVDTKVYRTRGFVGST